jgi:hypothetical protein
MSRLAWTQFSTVRASTPAREPDREDNVDHSTTQKKAANKPAGTSKMDPFVLLYVIGCFAYAGFLFLVIAVLLLLA